MENKCGYSKRNWAVPLPTFESHDQLAADFAEQARKDRERLHYAKGKRIADLWERDRQVLLALPETRYEAFRMSAAVVNKYGEVQADGTAIPLVGLVSPGREVMIQSYWDRFVVLTEQQQVVREVPRPYTGRTAEIPWVQVFANLLRKPRSVTHSQFVRMLPESVQRYVGIADLMIRKERLQAHAHWSGVYALSQIQEVLETTGDEATVMQLTAALSLQQASRDIPSSWSETLSPPGTQASPSLDAYDRLMGVS
ncbi:hypothetical protein [Paenibacillus senegalensis]|uniref:hypothetical protein n=1 Tax=Paenibacillus senegalensis TaxID=1465766 RepID=UPI000693728E|nr:hypothetical protein [Paenibacillus senegalensis]